MYNNSNRKNAVDKYKQQSIMTASSEELTLMLYNGCLKNISLGKDCIEKKDIAGKNEAIQKAQKIIKHLDGTLDMNIPISKEFEKMYDYIHSLLVEGNIKKDIEKLDQAYGLVVEFRDAWHQAMKKLLQKEYRVQSEMMEILEEYIRVTELQYKQANKPEEDFDMEALEKLIEERGKILKRIESVKQYLTDEDMKAIALKIEKMKRLEDRNIKAFKEHSKKIRIILDDLKKKKKNFETYRKNL